MCLVVPLVPLVVQLPENVKFRQETTWPSASSKPRYKMVSILLFICVRVLVSSGVPAKLSLDRMDRIGAGNRSDQFEERTSS